MGSEGRENVNRAKTSLTFPDAAEKVLRRTGRPLRAEEIVSKAIKLGLLTTLGKTPVRSMSAALYVKQARSPRGRFLRVAKPGPSRAVRNSVRWTLRRK